MGLTPPPYGNFHTFFFNPSLIVFKNLDGCIMGCIINKQCKLAQEVVTPLVPSWPHFIVYQAFAKL